jgi:regulator of protease activity HflC (stomatin/prohibitin superfamily)
VGIGVAVLLVIAVLLAPRRHRGVVLRSGRVRRVSGSGPAWHLPVLEQVVRIPSQPHQLWLRSRGRTLDGVPVLVMAEVGVRVRPPAVGDAWVDPHPTLVGAAERIVADLVATLPVVQLRHALRAAEPGLVKRISEVVGGLGAEVLSVEVLEVDLPLASDRGPG